MKPYPIIIIIIIIINIIIIIISIRLRRGFQVYKEVCQACHSMKYFYWRMHVDVTHTKEEVKEMAAEVNFIALSN